MKSLLIIFVGTFLLAASGTVLWRVAHWSPNDSVPRPAESGDHGSAPSIQTVNTTCAICGMPVDPALGTADYQGRRVGFGCRMCPPKFKADPERYGPSALVNQVVKDEP